MHVHENICTYSKKTKKVRKKKGKRKDKSEGDNTHTRGLREY